MARDVTKTGNARERGAAGRPAGAEGPRGAPATEAPQGAGRATQSHTRAEGREARGKGTTNDAAGSDGTGRSAAHRGT